MKAGSWFVLGIVATTVSWLYMHRILGPWEYYHDVQHGTLKAQLGDLYSPWTGTRELLLYGKNPYGDDVTRKIQLAFYGHAIQQNYDSPQVVDEQRFAYPIYVVPLLAPTVHCDFDQLQAWAPVVLASMIGVSVFLWLRSMGQRRSIIWTLALILFVLSSPQLIQGLQLQQLGLFVAFLLALATWCNSGGHSFVAGGLLALSTIKPQMVVLCVAWFLIWAVADLHKRWPMVAGFATTLGMLVGVSELLLRGWLRLFMGALVAYTRYVRTPSPIRLMLGNWVGGVVSVVLLIVVLMFAWKNREVAASSAAFHRVLAGILIVSTLVIPPIPIFNQVLLILPVILLLIRWRELPVWGQMVFSALVASCYVISIVMLLHPSDLVSPRSLPLLPRAPALVFPFAVLVLFLLSPASKAAANQLAADTEGCSTAEASDAG
ncbi:MAG TPA: glycosyltransferase 87 family protein [Candidatus Sulfotelmatobacter sp.]|nr:glycosyltransferase 87 family protein [Candidatus Sulfotelmatobacter sp.]